MPEGTKEPQSAPTVTTRKDGTTATSYGAARGHSWDQAGPGNFLAAKHGCRSERVLSDPHSISLILVDLIERMACSRQRRDDEHISGNG